MADRKVFLYFLLAFIVFLLIEAWHRDHPVSPVINTDSARVTTTSSDKVTKTLTTTLPASVQTQNTTQKSFPTVHVKTDVLDVEIDTQGGDFTNLKLPLYPVSYEKSDIPVQLLTSDPNNYYIAESGVMGEGGPNTREQQGQYSSDKKDYVLGPGENALTVVLHWYGKNGLQVNKIFNFQRGKYVVDVNYEIINKGTKTWSGNVYSQLLSKSAKDGGMLGLHTYRGPAISSPEKPYEKISYREMDRENLSKAIKGGWVAIQQRYFVSAWAPPQNLLLHYYSNISQLNNEKIYAIGFAGPTIDLKPGEKIISPVKFYSGPEIAEHLKEVAPHLELVIDYGWFWFLAIPLLKLLEFIHRFVGNWGWSIVIITILIKLVFYKLSETSYRSMAKMRELQPQLLSLREKYGNDRQKMSMATMELYRKEKVNPLGGCLPILVQIPVFIALYYVLVESVQLRQAPFILWIYDLSEKDPYYILPVLMGISMYVQQLLNPPSPDPMQDKVMKIMPLIFTVFFAAFPAGLVLYWLVNNCISILQQWYIMRRIEIKKNQPMRKK